MTDLKQLSYSQRKVNQLIKDTDEDLKTLLDEMSSNISDDRGHDSRLYISLAKDTMLEHRHKGLYLMYSFDINIIFSIISITKIKAEYIITVDKNDFHK